MSVLPTLAGRSDNPIPNQFLAHIECSKIQLRLHRMAKLIPEVEFLEEIQTEVLRVFLLAIHRHLY